MSGAPKVVTAAVIIIGNEILSGRTKDANLAFLGERLGALGVRLMEARVVPDIEDMIVEAVNQLRARYDYVLTTGGIGPTHDDITAECIAKAFGTELEYHPEALRLMAAQYKPGDFNEARKRMARVPVGGELIVNPVSKAPGFRIGNVFVMAGVPAIMRAMFERFTHLLAGGEPVQSRAVAAHLPEGTIAKGLGELQARFPDLDLGSYPYYRQGKFGTSIVARGTDAAAIDAAIDAVAQLMRTLGAEPIEEAEDA